MPATPEPAPAPVAAGGGSVLAFDVGRRIVGVAIGHRLTGTARALVAVPARNGTTDWDAIAKLVREWQPDAFVVGLPLALDGGEQPMSVFARAFGDELQKRFARPVHAVDERHTSREAARRFAAQRAAGTAKRKHADAIDALAAQIILESWLASAPATST